MKRKTLIILTVFTLIVTFCLSGCETSTSGFIAGKYITSNNSTSASMKFSTFKGNDDFKLKAKGDSTKTIKFTGKLGSGNATVYCQANGNKQEMFTIKAGENIDSSFGEFKDTSIVIIFEAVEKCADGEFTFKLE